MLKVAPCTVVRSYNQIFSAWWVTTISYNYGATLELRYKLDEVIPYNQPRRLNRLLKLVKRMITLSFCTLFRRNFYQFCYSLTQTIKTTHCKTLTIALALEKFKLIGHVKLQYSLHVHRWGLLYRAKFFLKLTFRALVLRQPIKLSTQFI